MNFVFWPDGAISFVFFYRRKKKKKKKSMINEARARRARTNARDEWESSETVDRSVGECVANRVFLPFFFVTQFHRLRVLIGSLKSLLSFCH